MSKRESTNNDNSKSGSGDSYRGKDDDLSDEDESDYSEKENGGYH